MNDDIGGRSGLKRIREPLLAAKDTTDRDRQELYEFGSFRLEPAERKLWCGNEDVVLTPKAFDTLVLLVRNSGHLLEKDELIRALWPDSFVEEGNLTNNISLLRKALGDDPPYIETVPKRGYRFIGAVRQLPTTVSASQAPVTSVDGTRRGTATGVRAAASARSRKIVVTAAVVMFAAGIAGGRLWRTRQAHRLTEKDTIVLADFSNTTGDPVFDDTLKHGLRVQLEQSPFLNILSDEKASEELQLMGRAKDERLTREVTREVCQRTGSKAILAGSISSLGTHYVIGLSALNCHSGEGLASEQVEADSREHVLKALGESATRMRKKLGESLTSVQKYDAPVEATTGSLEALKAYSLGMKTWSAKGVTASLPFFQRAVELDPQFAMAHARVAMVFWNLHASALGAEEIHKAYGLRVKVSEWERLYIEAHYYDHGTGELEKAAQVYQLWQQTYPRDWVPYNNLASLNALFGKYEEELEEARHALRLGPDNEDNYEVASFSYLALNRLDEAAAVFQQAEKRKLEGEGLFGNRYKLAFLRDDEREMEQLVAGAVGKSGAESELWFCEVLNAAYHGRRNKARELARQRRESTERSLALEEIADTWLATALIEGYFGNTQQARADARAALRLTSEGYVPLRAARALALAGDVTGAEKLVDESNKQLPLDTGAQKYWLPMIRANVALDLGNPGQAIELLRVVSPYELGAFGYLNPIYTRGQAYLMQRNSSAAAAEFQKIIDHRSIVWAMPLGALAHLGLARAYVLQGDTAKSRSAYQDFLTLWKDADPDIPVFKEAKAEYAKLQHHANAAPAFAHSELHTK